MFRITGITVQDGPEFARNRLQTINQGVGPFYSIGVGPFYVVKATGRTLPFDRSFGNIFDEATGWFSVTFLNEAIRPGISIVADHRLTDPGYHLKRVFFRLRFQL